jgi:hypothetical protein
LPPCRRPAAPPAFPCSNPSASRNAKKPAQKITSLSEEAETITEGTNAAEGPGGAKEKAKKDPYLKETTKLLADYLATTK